MFERYTERAVNVVFEAQKFAKEMNCAEVRPEHLLLALVAQAKGVSLKLFRMCGITTDVIRKEIELCSEKSQEKTNNLPFNIEAKEILKHTVDLANKSGNNNILFEHLFLSVISAKTLNIVNILEKFNFDIYGWVNNKCE